ncbi:hypothetical protein F3N42_05050 [Marinihelvus fidelis]|uniref:VWA domain-containing protein n=1 Tax=Marinihelvus fidelis TaxID=2613842 RepID=A0A5N0TH31_9GAMM|nr:VWA domain-containing protein [Marinihelvus fidelis]KAA9132589.1 hypothetical protein F3N42_05050 [Marinihelvus fidelis]
MRRRRGMGSVFSLSAIDLFASGMGAFIIITIILMPDYQKEVRMEGHLAYLDALARESETLLDETEMGVERLQMALDAARTRQLELEAEERILGSEINTLNAQLTARRQQPTPAVLDEELEDTANAHAVTFRFLGLKTEQTRYVLLVDMNKFLGEHSELVLRSVGRALDALQPGFEVGIIGFQQLDDGPRFHHWPTEGALAPVTAANRARALRWLGDRSGAFAGGSPMLAAFEAAYRTPAGAVILFSDGLPNPAFNRGLPARPLAQAITVANPGNVEVHAVTIGDYFKYQGTVAFMETLARANSGGFLALAQ